MSPWRSTAGPGGRVRLRVERDCAPTPVR